MTITMELDVSVEGPYVLSLRRQLVAGLRRDSDVVLRCQRVRRLSPAGRALLVSVGRAARGRGGHLRLESASGEMTAALRTTGLGHLLPLAVATPTPATGRPAGSVRGAARARVLARERPAARRTGRARP